MTTDLATIRAHWNSQATKGETSGTQDLILKQLEQRALLEAIGRYGGTGPRRGLEIGCGTGETARLVVEQYPDIELVAIDAADEMIQAAMAAQSYMNRLHFVPADILTFQPTPDCYDLAYSQRCLINLPTWTMQRHALDTIADGLKPGGCYFMLEHSQDGLDAINRERERLGLSTITPPQPWHTYFKDNLLATVTAMRLVKCIPFSATYYYHSRILNALDAHQHGWDVSYAAWLNQIALTMPYTNANPAFSQARAWIWVKP